MVPLGTMASEALPGPGPPVGFVQFTTSVMAQNAMKALDGQTLGGSVLKAKMALRDKDKGVDCKPSANLYICNLPPGGCPVETFFVIRPKSVAAREARYKFTPPIQQLNRAEYWPNRWHFGICV